VRRRPARSDPLPPAGALARLLEDLADVAPLPAVRTPLALALGRAPAAPVRAPAPLPGFDTATMDGYALRARDARRAGARLPVAFEVAAGHPARDPLPPGACARILTGAPLPRGADAVEQQEAVRRAGGHAIFERPAERGRFVRRRGSDVAKGSVALREAQPLDAGALALAASLGLTHLPLRRRPRVAIVPTGDELRLPGGRAQTGTLFESNGIALAAAAWEAGAEPDLLPPVPDDPAEIVRALRAARRHDAIVTVGGISVGDRDYVREALARAGARLHPWRVAMRPGRPFASGRLGASVLLCLPGNPASALVSFELFARPALRALAGMSGSGRLLLPARLSERCDKEREITQVLRVRLKTHHRGSWIAEPLRTQRSGDLASMAMVDALVLLPSGRARFPAGARVEALLLRSP
jgi:molybdopterin molybdotransferase